MKKLPLILGLTFGFISILLNLIFINTNLLDNLKEAGFVIFGLFLILDLPCVIFGFQKYICLLSAFIFWFGVGAGIGWLVSRK